MLLGQGADEFAGGYSAAKDKTTKNWQGYNQELIEKHQRILEHQKAFGLNDGSFVV